MMNKTTFGAVFFTYSMILGTTIVNATDTTFESAVVTQAPPGAPTSHKGIKTLKKQVVELGSEIPGMEGRELRIRLLTIEPGGYIKVHSHKNRPAAFYVIQGVTTITYGDGTVKRFPVGSMGYADKNTTHWHRNEGKETVVFVAADIFQPKKK